MCRGVTRPDYGPAGDRAPRQPPLRRGLALNTTAATASPHSESEPGSGTRGAMERFFKKRRLRLTTGMEMGSLEAVKQGVQAGLGLGLIPRDAVEMELRLERLVILNVVDFPIRRHWYVVLHKGKRLTPLAAAFRDLLTEEAVDLLQTA